MFLLTDDGEVWQRTWWGGIDGIEDCENTIRIGDYGFYGDWFLTDYTQDEFE